MKGIRLAFKLEYYDYYTDRRTYTDHWDDSDNYMFAHCCGADWYGRLKDASKLNKNQQEAVAENEYGIAVYRGKLKLKSNKERQVDHVRTRNGWLTVWCELPREEEPITDDREW